MTDVTADIVSVMRHPILVLDRKLSVTLVNRAFCECFQTSLEETKGRPVYSLGNGQWNIPRLRDLLENVLAENNAFDDFEVEHDFAGIGHRVMLLNARKIDHLQLILLAIEDVTDRRRSDEVQRASEERLRKVLETEAIGVLFFDESGTLIDANDVFLSETGYPREEIEAGELTWRTMTPPEWLRITEKEFNKLAATGRIGPYEKQYLRRDGSKTWMLFVGRGLGDGTTVEFCIDINDRKHAEAERELLTQELSHRVKNMLAVVQALATQMNGRQETVDSFREAFLGRLQALARAHSVLLDVQWRNADLKTLVEQAVEPYGADCSQVIAIEGGPVTVSAKQGLGLSLVLHELGTNAAKYGALSRPHGRLHISWEVGETDGGRTVQLLWQERHGPPVEPPDEKGFGMELIERACIFELDGEAKLDYAPEGLTCSITFPLV